MAPETSATLTWTRPHLLGLEALSAAEIRFLLDTADSFREVSTRSVKKVPALRGRVVVNAFFEDSTRTRNSFTLAAQRLSADVLEFGARGSSLSKGESLVDTAKTIEAMGVDVMVVRHAAAGAANLVARNVSCSVINAGDGAHEHPTQGLLDAYTIRQRLGRADNDFVRPARPDRRRHRQQPRRPQQCPLPDETRRKGHGLRSCDALPGELPAVRR